ncbi:histidine ammonia-lyase [Candidatus Paracaedibacter acanthamoebae]|uniref:tyrosine ammonia-lyase n=2 Tax=Candidatus Odyssella acanthamoebae TaxID=91604 RepID=A0A077B098_9PROT|nr:histidine ammonia-lyase [Candidatus Paracaedibacter acanthamoebae]
MTQIVLDAKRPLTIEEAYALSRQTLKITLSSDENFKTYIQKGADFLSHHFDKEGAIYGVTTGYGDNCDRAVPLDLVEDLPLNLSRFHGCGLGDYLTLSQTRMVLAIRLSTLCHGYSGVSFNLLKRLELLLDHDILPVIPSEGSVGASGDLTPLSYVAAVIMGERDVWYKGTKRSTAEVYAELGIPNYKMRPKEPLAIMNGTAVMTALAVEAFKRAEYLSRLTMRLTALTSLAIKGNPHHFNEDLFATKPHPGQMQAAAMIRLDLRQAPSSFPEGRLQDRYSTRCAPHIIGVLEDMLPVFRNMIEIEMNSANDNPLIYNEQILHGGHFYGGHIAFAMDSLKNLVANLADLLDRQMAVLVDPKFNNGLPANLCGIKGDRLSINHGLKALQIGASAWTAEALKQTMPASVFSRSTESHNQDKVSMGTIAARDALRVSQLTEQVAAAQLISTLQALRLREQEGSLSLDNYPSEIQSFLTGVAQYAPFIGEDQPLDDCLRNLISAIQTRQFPLYGVGE